MGLIFGYGFVIDKVEVIKFICVVYECGVILFDIVEVYGQVNEEMVGEVVVFFCDQIVIVIKFGFKDGNVVVGFDSCFECICIVVEQFFKCLKMDYIDFFYQYCVDLNVLMEDVVGVVCDFIQEGKVKYFGMCEVGVKVICDVYVVQFFFVLQSEYFMFICEFEDVIILMFEELGIGFIFFSLLGKGFLIGKIDGVIIFVDGDV